MPERLFYSPQAQLDLEEVYDYFADELGDSDKGYKGSELFDTASLIQ